MKAVPVKPTLNVIGMSGLTPPLGVDPLITGSVSLEGVHGHMMLKLINTTYISFVLNNQISTSEMQRCGMLSMMF